MVDPVKVVTIVVFLTLYRSSYNKNVLISTFVRSQTSPFLLFSIKNSRKFLVNFL